jgi:hypothetical protein
MFQSPDTATRVDSETMQRRGVVVDSTVSFIVAEFHITNPSLINQDLTSLTYQAE